MLVESAGESWKGAAGSSRVALLADAREGAETSSETRSATCQSGFWRALVELDHGDFGGTAHFGCWPKSRTL